MLVVWECSDEHMMVVVSDLLILLPVGIPVVANCLEFMQADFLPFDLPCRVRPCEHRCSDCTRTASNCTRTANNKQDCCGKASCYSLGARRFGDSVPVWELLHKNSNSHRQGRSVTLHRQRGAHTYGMCTLGGAERARERAAGERARTKHEMPRSLPTRRPRAGTAKREMPRSLPMSLILSPRQVRQDLRSP